MLVKRRKTLRRGELTREQKEAVRLERYEMDGRKCVDCGRPVIWEEGFWSSMHLMHLRSKGARGPFTTENTRTGCLWCHQSRHNAGGKPCPAKS